MKKFLILILSICFISPLFSQEIAGRAMMQIELSNWTGRWITSADTLKSFWLPIFDCNYFNLFVDFAGFTDSSNVILGYWLHPGDISSSTDSTTRGYRRNDLTSSYFMALETITDADSVNMGQIYFSGHYPAHVAYSPVRWIQYIAYASTDHDSLQVTSAKLIKQP